tara:strand:- start:338 stop:763 length:426 start_codon:yes stop_codon:yes gene_type:complete
MNIPDNIIDKSLYRKAKKDADKTYKRNSAYKSMYLQKKYKELGGRYKGRKTKDASTSRWLREKWIQVIPYLTKDEKIVCGEDNKKNKVCRPSVRIDKKTPITIQELEKIYDKKKLLSLARKKNRDMNGRLMWKTGKFISSK